MLFNSFDFLVFFIIVTILYWVSPQRTRIYLLLAASCLFYMAFIPVYILILFLTILIDYFAGIYIEKSGNKTKKAKHLLIFSIISTCLVLFVFKYYDFFIWNFISLCSTFNINCSVRTLQIILPIGLSFHTFQSLSYVIEVYRGKQKAEKDFVVYSLYVMFYPQLVAGPIERAAHLLPQLKKNHRFSFENLRIGLLISCWGFFKKVVIADRLSLIVDNVYRYSDNYDGYTCLLSTYFFAFQIYCDFSGYSDIARGVAKIMGYDLMVNFNYPYLSKSIREFWNRWHISLSSWFKEYLYIPLGGNKVSATRNNFNLLFTFLVSGLWHGANWTYVVWGGINGVYLITERYIPTLSISKYFIVKLLKTVLVFHLILISWVFFRASSITEALAMFSKFSQINFQSVSISIKHFILSYGVIWYPGINKTVIPFYDSQIISFSLLILFLVSICMEYKGGFLTRFFNKNTLLYYIVSIVLVVLILLFGVLFENSSFIYFQF